MAKIESATPVSHELQSVIKDGLNHIYGPGITTNFSLNPALIGGMRIQVGSDVYDGSIRSGLNSLQRKFGIDGAIGANNPIGS
jgi:F-type H+-transporting ATPase subunit delta